MSDLLNRTAAGPGGDDPLIRLAVELADHVATFLVCRPGNMYAYPAGMALNHSLAAKRLEVLADAKTARTRSPRGEHLGLRAATGLGQPPGQAPRPRPPCWPSSLPGPQPRQPRPRPGSRGPPARA